MAVFKFFFSETGLAVIIMFNRNQTRDTFVHQLADVEIGFQVSKTNNLLVKFFWILGKSQMISALLAQMGCLHESQRTTDNITQCRR